MDDAEHVGADDRDVDTDERAEPSAPRVRPHAVAGLVLAMLSVIGTIVLGGLWLTHRDGPRLSEDTLCSQDHVVTRNLFIATGGSAGDNVMLVRGYSELIRSPRFTTALAPRLMPGPAWGLSSDELAKMITVTAHLDDSTVTVAVRSNDLTGAERVSDQVLPTLLEIIDDTTRGLPPEARPHGPPPQEVTRKPALSTVCRSATGPSPSAASSTSTRDSAS